MTWKLIKTNGIVNAINCTIKNSIAEGGAEFNAYIENGNVDKGNNSGWIFQPFTFSIDTELGENTTFILPLIETGEYDFYVDWGDGSPEDHITDYSSELKSHTYAVSGTYDIKIRKTLKGWSFGELFFEDGNYQNYLMITEIKVWGVFNFAKATGHFSFCENLTITATDIPNLSETTSLRNAFSWCYNILEIPNIENWDVSNVTDMSEMFSGISAFNQYLENWNVSNVTDMFGMFSECSNFNQPLNNWDVSNVTDMSFLFVSCSIFNQPLDNWDVSNVTNMSRMFDHCSNFNQSLNNWNVSNVTDMSEMFVQCSNFNQPLNNWDVSNVTDMTYMFFECSIFNQSLNNWNVSNVTSMSGMFSECSNFNQPLNNWDVSNISYINGMFDHCSNFNQPLNNWDVSNVTDMSRMFLECSIFDQDVGSWNITNVWIMDQMFLNSGFSTENYEKLLVGWASKNVQNNVVFHAGSAKYHSDYANEKDILTEKGWVITDGGMIS